MKNMTLIFSTVLNKIFLNNLTIFKSSHEIYHFFPTKKPSAFNLSPANLRLHNKQEKAVKEAEGKEVLAFPMNYSSGGPAGGRRTRKHRGGSCRKI
jgi:hypothetical protein